MAFHRNKFCSLTYHMCYLALIVCRKGRSFPMWDKVGSSI